MAAVVGVVLNIRNLLHRAVSHGENVDKARDVADALQCCADALVVLLDLGVFDPNSLSSVS